MGESAGMSAAAAAAAAKSKPRQRERANRFHMNISQRLAVWFLGIALLPFLTFTLIVNDIGERNAREEIYDTLTVSANNQVNRLEHYIQDQERTAELLARQTVFTTSADRLQDPMIAAPQSTMQAAQVREYARQVLPKTDFSDLALVGMDNTILFGLNDLANAPVNLYDPNFPLPTMRQVVENTLSTLDTSISDLMLAPDGSPVMFVSTPIFLGSHVVGALVLCLDSSSSHLFEIVTDRVGLGETGETVTAMLKDGTALFTAPTHFAPDAAFNLNIPLGDPRGQGIQQAVQGMSGQGELISYRNVRVVAVWRYIPSLRWGLVTQQDSSEAFRSLEEQRRAFVPIVLGTIGLVTLLAWFVSRSFTYPIHHLTDAVERMSGGDLKTRVGDIRVGKEFKVLANGFDKMAGDLDNLVGSLEERITERTRQLEKYALYMAAARGEADRANAAKTVFLTNMSHELRTPLNAILGFAQMLQTDRAVPPKQREHIGTIARSGEHLLGLINELLDMARIESGQIVLAESAFDLRYLLRGIDEMMTLRAEAKNIQLEFEIADNVPQFIRADEGKMRQIIINLVGNSIKFTANGGVSVGCGLENQRLRFEVEDTGAGIAQEDIEKLFQPFMQTEIGARAQEGTGLGLAISRAYVRAMGGDLTATSRIDQGTVFTFDLPLAAATSDEVRTGIAQNRRPVGIAAPDDTREWRILVVDDKSENRQLMRLWMEEVGFEVREASNGREAVTIWEAWEPHLIWMDMRMPVMDGYAATRQIKATVKGSATTVIALTASALDMERQLVMSAGCDDFVRKPARVETIFGKLEQHLGIRFLYETPEDEDDDFATPSDPMPLNRETLASMPETWRVRMREAVLRVDMETALRLARELDGEHPAVARDLVTLINAFRFDTLQELV